MNVAELMQTNLKTISVDATVGEAVKAIARERVSALPVIDRFGRAVGVVSTRAVLAAQARSASTAARDQLLRQASVLEIMEPWPPTISPDADIRDAAQALRSYGTQRLFVQRDGALVGVISQTDVVAALAQGRLAAVAI